MKTKAIKRKKSVKKDLEPVVFFSFKKKVYILLRQKLNKGQFSLLTNKKDSTKEFNRLGRKVRFGLGDFTADLAKAKSFHLSELGRELVLSFISSGQTFLAFSRDGLKWTVKGVLSKIIENGCLSPHKTNDNKFAYFYGDKEIKVAYSSNLINWKSDKEPFLKPRAGLFDKNNLRVVSTCLSEKGVGLIYESSGQSGWERHLQTGYVLLAKDNLSRIIWRADLPLTEDLLKAGGLADIRSLGVVLKMGIFYFYYRFGTELFVISGRDPFSPVVETTKKLVRSNKNPIIWPKETQKWQAVGTFNPGAVYLNGQVHLVYRAVGENGLSTIGYALLKDGLQVESESDKPVFISRPASKSIYNLPMFVYESGPGGLGGTEDPRLTRIGNRIYMLYVHFNGYEAPRMAMTSISVHDFLNKRWVWRRPVFLSKRHQTQKNWVLFPEKINGQFALLCSLTPQVQIIYFDKLPMTDVELESVFKNKPGVRRWDNWMRGVGAPPIRTEYGWLVLYHAMDIHDPNKYKAMILDYKNPEKILYRSANPILAPDKRYENEGFKAGVVYVCGAVTIGDTLFVYYGGADTVVCVATIPLQGFLKSLTTETQEEIGRQEIFLL
jgi:predicted GH43/DUF377 family glycosyl hydrolase